MQRGELGLKPSASRGFLLCRCLSRTEAHRNKRGFLQGFERSRVKPELHHFITPLYVIPCLQRPWCHCHLLFAGAPGSASAPGSPGECAAGEGSGACIHCSLSLFISFTCSERKELLLLQCPIVPGAVSTRPKAGSLTPEVCPQRETERPVEGSTSRVHGILQHVLTHLQLSWHRQFFRAGTLNPMKCKCQVFLGTALSRGS